MKSLRTSIVSVLTLLSFITNCESAKINTPRVLLPWFENLYVNFTFEIIEGGCYSWSLSRDDIIDLVPLYEDTWGHCSRAARVSVSKTCIPPGSVIILAEEVNTGEILRGDVDVDIIRSLKIMSTTRNLYLEEAPEAFEVVAYDDKGNKFSSLEGISFTWNTENVDNSGNHPLITLVQWKDTDYEAPQGIAELEAQGLQSYSVLLYGQAMGESHVTVCLDKICTDFYLHVVASVVLTPAVAYVAPGDTLRYKVVRARAGRLTVQDVAATIYRMELPQSDVATLEDGVSLVRAAEVGTSHVYLKSEATEVAMATLTVVEPYSIRVTLRPSNMIIRGEQFTVHCVVFDEDGHPLTAGPEISIRLTVNGEADVLLMKSTENGTITDAVAYNTGEFTVTAKLVSVAGKSMFKNVEGQITAKAVDPLAMVPPEMFIAWTESNLEFPLKHSGGGDEHVTWSERQDSNLVLTPAGLLTVRGVGHMDVRLHLTKYPHIQASGRVWSAVPELLQVSTSGTARVARPHHLHIKLTGTHPATGELYNFNTCNCASFAVSLVEGPEPQNVTAAPWVKPKDGACCVVECTFLFRGVSTLLVSRGRAADTARVAVRAAPSLLWPHAAALLPGATIPVIGEGESLIPQSSQPRVAELIGRDGAPPHNYPDAQLFTLKCQRKGEALVELSSLQEERESVSLETWCSSHVTRVRLDPPDTQGNCSGPRLWLRPGQEVPIKVTLFDTIGRQLLDEDGPIMQWDVQPYHIGIGVKTTDRLFVETNSKYAPVPVPDKYYQLVVATEQAIGWSGSIKAAIPDTSATIQAKVVSPLKCDPMKVHIAWEGETVPNISAVTGGSGKYIVETPKGVTASVDEGRLSAVLPTPGTYDLIVADSCVSGEKNIVEVIIEEVLSVEVSTARAVCVDNCIPIRALVKGVSHRYLATSREPDWKTEGDIVVRKGQLCGLREGVGRVRASLGGVWSQSVEVWVFPSLAIVPERSRVAVGGRVHLNHAGGPPRHLASLLYTGGGEHAQVSSSGVIQGLYPGSTRVKLVAVDAANVELASAEAEIEVVPITTLRVRAATQTLLVGSPGPVWIEAAGLTATALSSLQPLPRVTWALRDPTMARIYTSHIDDRLERSVIEGLSIRVVPLKPGVITLDVRVRNMGQVAETRSWDSTIEILGVSDIRTSIEGLRDINSGEMLSLAVGSTVRLKSLPKGRWSSYQDEKAVIHVEVAIPYYCTVEPAESSETWESLRVVTRSVLGRELLSPQANVSVMTSLPARIRRNLNSARGSEITLSGLDSNGAFMSFESSLAGVTVSDEVFIPGSDAYANRIVATGGSALCIEGSGWTVPAGIQAVSGAGLTLAVLMSDAPAMHVLRLDRPPSTVNILQLPLSKMEFLPGEWPASLVPLSIQAEGLTSGPLLCTEEQKYALAGVDVDVPFSCRTAAPFAAQAVLDIPNGRHGCAILPGNEINEAVEVELCAEWGVLSTCTKVQLLPPIQLSQTRVSLLNPPSMFIINGHPNALKAVKITPSPGLKVETNSREGQISVTVKSESTTCGVGWVNVISKLTSQEIRVEVERECEIACGTLLGVLFSIMKPYLSTLVTVAVIAVGYLYVQNHLQQKGQIQLPKPPQTTLQTPLPEPRSRTWSRSPYASNPSAPVYGDTSMLPDASFSPTSTRIHSRLL
nr:uncharacterized protein LOC116771416 [Danaus plexippus plexippus]